MAEAGFTFAESPRKKLAVISHERSGTHFLMNSVASHFGYLAKPWWNFDFEQAVNFQSQKAILRHWMPMHNRPVLNILKSHHPATFFSDILGYLTEQFHVLYIYRDPRDALMSHWKLILTYEKGGGPKSASAGEFIRAEPSGSLLRYQLRQERNMVQRWRTHVESWLDAANQHPDYPLCIMRYEDLNEQFAATMDRVAAFTGLPHDQLLKPNPKVDVMGEGSGGGSGGYRNYLDEADLAFVADEAGDFMGSLGYSV